MEEFKQWLSDMKEHFEKAKDRSYMPDQVAFREGQIDFAQMCIDWFKPNYMRFNPKEAEKEL